MKRKQTGSVPRWDVTKVTDIVKVSRDQYTGTVNGMDIRVTRSMEGWVPKLRVELKQRVAADYVTWHSAQADEQDRKFFTALEMAETESHFERSVAAKEFIRTEISGTGKFYNP